MIIAGKSQSTQRTGLPWLVDQQFPHRLQILLLIENRIDRNNQAFNRPTPQYARPRFHGELVFTVFKQILLDYQSVSINEFDLLLRCDVAIKMISSLALGFPFRLPAGSRSTARNDVGDIVMTRPRLSPSNFSIFG